MFTSNSGLCFHVALKTSSMVAEANHQDIIYIRVLFLYYS